MHISALAVSSVVALLLSTIVGILVAFEARRRHKKRRSLERRCAFHIQTAGFSGRCDHKTTRHYQMLRSTDLAERWWNWCYRSIIIDVCNDGHARVISPGSVTKLFTSDELLWRLLSNWSQFKEDRLLWDMVEQTKQRDHLVVNHYSGHAAAHLRSLDRWQRSADHSI